MMLHENVAVPIVRSQRYVYALHLGPVDPDVFACTIFLIEMLMLRCNDTGLTKLCPLCMHRALCMLNRAYLALTIPRYERRRIERLVKIYVKFLRKIFT